MERRDFGDETYFSYDDVPVIVLHPRDYTTGMINTTTGKIPKKFTGTYSVYSIHPEEATKEILYFPPVDDGAGVFNYSEPSDYTVRYRKISDGVYLLDDKISSVAKVYSKNYEWEAKRNDSLDERRKNAKD